ncbi:MAG TPA: hypothetical protein VFC28_03335 [Opitutaceae bacterium]|nr:hypothetical protein [Opitutaceae bacterium]
MRTAFTRLRCRTAALAPLALVLVLLGGCLEKHLVWSPDGARAAVVAKDGLHLCDPAGTLTPLLQPGVYQVAWMGDSQQLVVARAQPADGWTAVARALGPAQAAEMAARAAEIGRKIEAGGKWGDLTAELGEKNVQAVLKVLLRERYGDVLRGKMTAGEWNDLKSTQVEINELLTARVDGGQVRPGIVLHEGLEKIEDIRVSPGDRAVAFTTDLALDNDKECRLRLARIDVAGSTTVAERTAAFPDWTPDRRALVYFQAAEGGTKDELRLGTLVRRGVLDDHDRIKVQDDAEELAGAMFSNTARVRCLRDGRILFNAAEMNLPVAIKDADVEREHLFALDPARQSTLVRVIPRGAEEKMPKNLTFFELSPDEKQALVGGFEGEVSVLTIATGEVEVVQEAGEYNLRAAPVWRSSDEITYTRRNPSADGKPPARKAEVVRRKVTLGPGDHEMVLSQDWSGETLESIFSGSGNK